MSTLIFCELEHTYYIVPLELEQTDYDTEADFIKEHGPLPPVNLTSVTTFLDEFSEDFPEEEILDKMMKGQEFYMGKNPEYQGMLKEEIRTTWRIKNEQAKRYGTFVHLGAENIALTGKAGYPTRPEFEQAKRFFKNEGYTIVAAEKRIVSEKYMIAGTVDLLLEKDGIMYIGDWKTNHGKDLADCHGDRWTEMMKKPFHMLEDLPFWHYALQFSLYQYILEEEEQLEFGGRFAIHLKREGLQYQKIEMPYLQGPISKALSARAETLSDLEKKEPDTA